MLDADEWQHGERTVHGFADPEGPCEDVSALAAGVRVGFVPGEERAQDRLEEMLDENILHDVAHGDAVSLQELGWGVQFVLGQVSAFVEGEEEER